MELFDKIAIKLRHFLWIMNELIIITIRCSGETLWILWLLLQNCRGLKSSRKVLRFRTELRSLALTRSSFTALQKALLLLRYSSAPNYFQLVLHCWAEFDSLPCVDTFWNSFSLPLRFKLHLRPFFSNNLIIWTGILLTDLLSRLIAAHHETTVYVMCYYSSPFYTRPHTSDSPEWKHLNMETEKERHGWRKLPVDRYAAPLLPIS